MLGYATDETPELVLLTLTLSHKLNRALSIARKTGVLPWLRPDTKAQVNSGREVNIDPSVPVCVDTVFGSTQRWDNLTTILYVEPLEEIIKKVIPVDRLRSSLFTRFKSVCLPNL